MSLPETLGPSIFNSNAPTQDLWQLNIEAQ
jgi:hypothetical protein